MEGSYSDACVTSPILLQNERTAQLNPCASKILSSGDSRLKNIEKLFETISTNVGFMNCASRRGC